MALLRWTVRIHKWLALLVGIQIILWVVGGFGMSLLPIEQVRGEHNMAPVERGALPVANLITPQEAARVAGVEAIQAITVSAWMDKTVYRITPQAGAIVMVDAQTGAVLSPIDEATARAVALADHIGDPAVLSAELLIDPPREFGRPGPVWQIMLDDGEGTRSYVSPATGEVVTRRNDRWRLFDFLWMLHIMDYEEREDFNHPLLISASALALMTVLAGLVLLVLRMQRLAASALAARRRG